MAHCRPCPDCGPRSQGSGTWWPMAQLPGPKWLREALRIPATALGALGFPEGFQTLQLWGHLSSSGNIRERKGRFVYFGLKLP